MILIYGEAYRNARETCRLCQKSFPNNRHPAQTTFPKLERRLRETGSLSPNKHPCGLSRRRRTPDFEEVVIQHFEEQPEALHTPWV
jgi:hypothetical protein